ncbi:MAG: hypothetical protein M1812_004787 [Candelaria pacifica]|nr:MAG: hypothetical protein M1812_004787 [Candelaria pacifica]
MSNYRRNQSSKYDYNDAPPDTSHSYRHHRSRHPSDSRRSHSPHESKHLHDSIPHQKRRRSRSPESVRLPFGSRHLSKDGFKDHRPIFALYLDIQKKIVLEDIDDIEVRGRWKSFIGKCQDLTFLRNRGELAEGWYDPSTKQKAISSFNAPESTLLTSAQRARASPDYRRKETDHQAALMDESEDDFIGPTLPAPDTSQRRVGPAIPGVEDIVLRQEVAREDSLAARDDIRFARKRDRKQQKEQLNELVPRAEAGTRERQLEKKKELNEKLRSFRDKSPGAAEEVGDQDLMGDDGIEGYKAKKKDFERKKNERELRKEEMLRIRAAEREERFQEHRSKEDKTMAMLKSLARQNFG